MKIKCLILAAACSLMATGVYAAQATSGLFLTNTGTANVTLAAGETPTCTDSDGRVVVEFPSKVPVGSITDKHSIEVVDDWEGYCSVVYTTDPKSGANCVIDLDKGTSGLPVLSAEDSGAGFCSQNSTQNSVNFITPNN